MKKSLLTALLICMTAANIVFATTSNSSTQNIMVPAGTTLRTIITSPITSESAVSGQTVSTALCDDFYYNGKLIAPAGSIVNGTIIEHNIRFNNILTPCGAQIPITGVINNNVEIISNAVIDLVLTQPATVSSASHYYEN